MIEDTVSNSFQKRSKIAFVVTSQGSVTFFKGQLAFLAGNGFDVEIASSPGPRLDAMCAEGATTCAIPMSREIALAKDIVSLWRLWRHYRRERPDLVVAGTPKAGLLGTLAARAAGVPHVVYTLHGLRLETATGWRRALLWSMEWIACHAAHHVRSVSPSLRTRVIDLRLVAPEDCCVSGAGTSNGIHFERWRKTPEAVAIGFRTREQLDISPTALVIGFVGRFTRDKGIVELYEAFKRLRLSYPALRLLLVGDFEAGDPVPPKLRGELSTDRAVIITGFVADVAPYYWTMDMLALPTYREGFPGVPLEAQAASVPVVCTDATGAIDAMIDGVTGLRVRVRDVDTLTSALGKLLGNPALREEMGASGCNWVRQNFRQEVLWQDLLAVYRSILLPPYRGRQTGLRRLVKLALDRLVALVLITSSAPIWLVVALAIRCSMGAPILFRQVRPGMRGLPFTLFKFRTMLNARDDNGNLLPDADRLTFLGRLLRSTSLDELPQLLNVLRGEMSLVGPRPLLMEYLARYTPEQARRHDVMPGITGWAQVNGRNALSWRQKFDLDLWYIDNWSVWLDIRILWKTLTRVISREGISQDGHATMPEFTGSTEKSAPLPSKL